MPEGGVTPAVPVTGSFSSANQSASSVPVSGINLDPSAYFSGPHAITLQSLNVTHVRTPYGEFSATNWDLQNGPNPAYLLQGTRLLCVVKATYSQQKSYDWLSLSGFQQPQTFEINGVSSDPYGNASIYLGGQTSLEASQLGCRGSVDTSTAFYSIEPWNDNIHNVAACSVEGANFLTITSGCTGAQNYYDYWDQQKSAPDFDLGWTWKGAEEKYSPIAVHRVYKNYPCMSLQSDPVHAEDGFTYPLDGPYLFGQETEVQRNTYLNSIGTLVTGERLHAIWWKGPPTFEKFVGIPEYRISRHKY